MFVCVGTKEPSEIAVLDAFDYAWDAWIVDAVIDVYAVAATGEYALIAHEVEVLGGHSLFDAEGFVDGGDVELVESIEELDDHEADRVADAFEHGGSGLDGVRGQATLIVNHGNRRTGLCVIANIYLYTYMSRHSLPARRDRLIPFLTRLPVLPMITGCPTAAHTEASVDIKPNRLVYLGYGKYWRSDQIVGLVPIEEERGPGRRTHVHVATLDRPIVASRSEETIRREMAAAGDEEFTVEELRTTAGDLLEDLSSLSPVLRRVLLNEAKFDVHRWERRLRSVLGSGGSEAQEDLFPATD